MKASELQAGPELDARIAEQCLGWRWWRYRLRRRVRGADLDRGACKEDPFVRSLRSPGFPSERWRRWSERHDGCLSLAVGTEPLHPIDGTDVYAVEMIPAYSTDDAAALSALEKWSGDWVIRRQNGVYRCELFQPSDEWEALAPTLALAACRALMEAVERPAWK